MKFAKRIGQVPAYPFVQISRKIAEKQAQGVDVISFGIGDPDIPTPSPVIDELQAAALDVPNHRYPESEGLPAFREAVADWYHRRFEITLDSKSQIMSLIGAKEGIGHASLSLIEPGDIALVPDPGYPVYAVGTLFAGGTSHRMALREGNAWLPDFSAIPEDIARKATVLWLNYPNNPTGATAELDFFEEAVSFAKKHKIAVMHDACYSEVSYDGYKPSSFLQSAGAIDIGLEFHSLSKSYNMTGWRVGMAVGNSELIDGLMTVKSNLDSGVPQAIQRMAIAAMQAPLNSVDERNSIYQGRRDMIVSALQNMGLYVSPPKASLYVWARVPDGYNSADFTEKLLDDTDVLVMNGAGYGKYGDGYIRLSITIPDDRLETALERMSSWNA